MIHLSNPRHVKMMKMNKTLTLPLTMSSRSKAQRKGQKVKPMRAKIKNPQRRPTRTHRSHKAEAQAKKSESIQTQDLKKLLETAKTIKRQKMSSE